MWFCIYLSYILNTESKCCRILQCLYFKMLQDTSMPILQNVARYVNAYTSMPKRMYIFIIFIILRCLNYDVQFLILFGVYYDCTNKSFKCYVIQLLLCIKGSAIMYHAKFSLISNEIASFIRFNIDALQFFHVKASVTWF
jgi:hypothetical protein